MADDYIIKNINIFSQSLTKFLVVFLDFCFVRIFKIIFELWLSNGQVSVLLESVQVRSGSEQT